MMSSLSAEIGVRDGSGVDITTGVDVRATVGLGGIDDGVGGVGVHVEGSSKRGNGASNAVARPGCGRTVGTISPVL
jgi:hypothetical protein